MGVFFGQAVPCVTLSRRERESDNSMDRPSYVNAGAEVSRLASSSAVGPSTL